MAAFFYFRSSESNDFGDLFLFRRVWHPAIPTLPPMVSDSVGIARMLYPPMVSGSVGYSRMLYPPMDGVCVGIARMLYPPMHLMEDTLKSW